MNDDDQIDFPTAIHCAMLVFWLMTGLLDSYIGKRDGTANG